MKSRVTGATSIATSIVLFAAIASVSRVQQAHAQSGTASPLQQAIDAGLSYLREHGQAEDGTFTIQAGPGLTALALTAALRNGLSVDDPMVAKGLKALEGFVKPDGGIYGNGRLRNYETCVAIVCFQLANKDGRYKELLANADKFVRTLQYGEESDANPSYPWYGGVGYGGRERPDLSNTSYLIDALSAGEAGANDVAIKRALAFVSRCQNLKGPHNDTKFSGLVNDGGFYYSIPTENEDPSTSERYDTAGGLRSYGSMTYSGFKSLVYAGLTQEDPRVKAAMDWIKQNYTVESNPGQGDAGLYYYYHAFAAALKASALDTITDDAGNLHDWRSDLVKELVKRQRPDGSWANANRRWFENDANLSTSFALIALSYCDKQPKQPQ